MPKKYSQKDLLDAVAAVRQGLFFRQASAKYGVPVMTIQNRVSGKIEDTAQPGRPTAIPGEVEEIIVQKIKEAASQGFGITRRMLAIKVGRMVRRMSIKTPFKNGIPGKDWISGFMKRHTDITLRKPLALSTMTARMLNETVTNNYFEALYDLISKLNLTDKPHLIWNVDETSVSLCHKPAKILGEKNCKNIPGRVGNSRDNVSVLACINSADGEIPPMAIVKGKTHKSLLAYNTSAGVPGSVYTYQERAWMEDVLGVAWFTDHFLKHCGSQRPQLIIHDSHSSHETLGLIDAAKQNNISLLAFPPHTTQWLCPLDKTVFGPLSREYSTICTEFMAASPNNIVSKWEWPRLFRFAHGRAFSSSNIISGFKKCGIFPVNRYAIPSSAFAPSKPFDKCHPSTCLDDNYTACKQNATPTSSTESCSVANCTITCTGDASVGCKKPQLPNIDTQSCGFVKATNFDSTDVSFQPGFEPIQYDSAPTTVELISEQELINSVLSGQIPSTIDNDGNLEISLEVANETSWPSLIDTEFVLPKPVDVQKKTSHKKLTSHRLLTSDEIFFIKKEESERKEKIKLEKDLKKEAKVSKKKVRKDKQNTLKGQDC